MKINFRAYQKNKIETLLKKNNFVLFALGANQKSPNWITLEQNLHELGLAYTKIYNNLTTKVFQNSVTKKLKNTIHSTFFFLTHKKTTAIIKSNFLNEITASALNVVALRLNKKLYAVPQLKKLNSFHEKKNIAVLYQFLSTTIKSPHRFKDKQNKNFILKQFSHFV